MLVSRETMPAMAATEITASQSTSIMPTTTGCLRLPHARQHIAAIGDQTQGLEHQEGGDGQDDDGQQADVFHAAAPRERTRADSCSSAD